ncbi:MAG: hypothetical protein CBC38_07925 [Gammaproteobacteria bacterium TMED78]|nr:MAG: hypothetical protein CBC38_07925 [Gammaproteobacteria bacterium TMED78]|tara:strand:- start:1631 stop:3466 length:1836 start_codon:yes stop_codon:yes gene_type:complete
MYILGISAFYHDSAAALIKDGEVICAAQEERFTRNKHDNNFPENAINFCLDDGKISPIDISNIVFYEKPFLKFERLLETYLAFAPKGFKSFSLAMPIWIKEKLFQKHLIINNLKNSIDANISWNKKLLFSEHHLSHAASAFYPSPYKKSAILTLDGVGEWATTTFGIGIGKDIEILKEINFPHSIGLLYSAFTYYIGFKVNSGEYKLMGLAPYGKPKYTELIKKNLIDIKMDGSFKVNMDYFNYCTGLTMTNNKFHQLFGGLPRKPESKISQKDMDLAASIQSVVEDLILILAKELKSQTSQSNLCLAGGVALNCVANGVLKRANIFDNIWIQPAAGDAGGALGAALAIWHMMYKKDRVIDIKKDYMKGSYLGPSFSDYDINKSLTSVGAKYKKLDDSKLTKLVAKELLGQKAIGWMQGRMEFGPRALGCRSILADPRSPIMQKQLNLKVKFRESFRPFAPSVLSDYSKEWFDIDNDSPFMLLVATVNKQKIELISDDKELSGFDKLNLVRSKIPAVTHVDYSARIQTVHKETNPRYYDLINEFNNLTGCPILVNTSFNIRGEPIVCTPVDAFNCFMGTQLDILVIENFILYKEEQNKSLVVNYENKYELD